MATFGVVTVVGVGLIGGSIGKALKSRGLADRVVGVGRNQEALAEAKELGAIDAITTNLGEGVAESDVVVICTPVDRVAEFAVRAAAQGPAGVLVTDAGSTKRRIVEGVERDARARGTFVGAHPIAGSEQRGAAHAVADLFEGRACVLTPTPATPADRLARAREFWKSIGCRLIEIGPAEHDETLALTSHLPHAVAAALAAAVPAEALAVAAGAYRDGTRVAGADGPLWAAIFAENQAPVLRALDLFEAELSRFRRALSENDAEALRDWWEAARSRRSLFRTGPGGSGAA